MKKLQRAAAAGILAVSALFFLSIYTVAQAADVADFARPNDGNAPFFSFNPTTEEKVAVGRRFFFDTRLSASNTVACASCHTEETGWSDPRRFSLNDDGEPLERRSMPLIGIGWATKLGWSLGVDNLEGFSVLPIAKAKEMGQDVDVLAAELNRRGEYAADMTAAFGSPNVTISRLTQSLAAFMRTLMPPMTPFDAWAAGDTSAVSESAKAGFVLFTGKAGCAACHSGWRFTDDSFHDIGLVATDDIGRAVHDPDGKFSQHAFKTPTLRGVKLRPPYMHDGSVATLADAVEHYVSGIHPRSSLSPSLMLIELTAQEKLNVLDFLNTL